MSPLKKGTSEAEGFRVPGFGFRVSGSGSLCLCLCLTSTSLSERAAIFNSNTQLLKSSNSQIFKLRILNPQLSANFRLFVS